MRDGIGLPLNDGPPEIIEGTEVRTGGGTELLGPEVSKGLLLKLLHFLCWVRKCSILLSDIITIRVIDLEQCENFVPHEEEVHIGIACLLNIKEYGIHSLSIRSQHIQNP